MSGKPTTHINTINQRIHDIEKQLQNLTSQLQQLKQIIYTNSPVSAYGVPIVIGDKEESTTLPKHSGTVTRII